MPKVYTVFFIYSGHTKRAISVSISADGFCVVSLAKDSLIKVHSFIDI